MNKAVQIFISDQHIRPGSCFNPPVLKSGECTLEVGKLYLMFWRPTHIRTSSVVDSYRLQQNGPVLLLKIDKNPDNDSKIPNLTGFEFLVLNENQLLNLRLGSNEDFDMFYFEEVIE